MAKARASVSPHFPVGKEPSRAGEPINLSGRGNPYAQPPGRQAQIETDANAKTAAAHRTAVEINAGSQFKIAPKPIKAPGGGPYAKPPGRQAEIESAANAKTAAAHAEARRLNAGTPYEHRS